MKHDNALRLLIIERTSNDAELLLNVLRRGRYAVRPRYVQGADELQEALDESTWDLILSVPNVGKFEVSDVMELVRRSKQDTPLIVVYDDQIKDKNRFITDTLRLGAKDAIARDELDHILLVVARELDNLAERRDRRRTEHAFVELQKRVNSMMDSSQDAIAYVHDGMHIHGNPTYLEMFGYKDMDELEGLPVMDLIAADDQGLFKEVMRQVIKDGNSQSIKIGGHRADGEEFVLRMDIAAAKYDDENCLQVVIKNQSVSDDFQQQLEILIKRDQLTGLYNHQYFLHELNQAVTRALDEEERSVLINIRLDDFDSIRDNIGPAASDQVIQDIAELLHNQVSEHEILARFGDSEFAILRPQKGTKYALALSESICKEIKGHISETPGQSVATTCSIGIAPIKETVLSTEEALEYVSQTCKEASDKGGNRVEVYTPAADPGRGPSIQGNIAQELNDAINEKRLSLFHQPIVSLHGDTNRIYEAFLRMRDRDGEIIAGSELIAAAEKENLITELDKWVIENALSMLKSYQDQGESLHLFIKLSDAAIRDETVLLHLTKELKKNNLKGECLTLEISEITALGQVKHAKSFVTALKKLNCSAAIEHFGTGLNSFSILNHLDVEYLKIDGSLIKNLSNDKESQATVRSIHARAGDLGKTTIATSVQDATSLAILWQSGINFAQGNYIQEPDEAMEYDFSGEETEDISF